MNRVLEKESKGKVRWFFTDDVLTDEAEDKFGHTSFVETLKRILSECTPPFSIGVFGTWGLGKSTIAKFLENKIKNENWETVNINLWKYSSKSLRRIILIEIAKKVCDKKELDNLFKELYTEIEKPMAGSMKDIWQNYGLVVVIWLIVMISIIGILIYSALTGKFVAGIAAFPVTALGYALTKLTEKLIGFSKTVKKKETLHEEQFESLLIEKIRKAGKKVLVYLDDLDRCSGLRVIEVLEIVKTYFEIPRVEIVFIVMCDEDRIVEAIRKTRLLEEPISDTKPTESSEDEREPNHKGEGEEDTILQDKDIELAKNYINKVFTFQLSVPEFKMINLPTYALELAKENKYGIYNELAKKGKDGEREFRDIIGILINARIDTPREVKLILNAFSNAYLLAKDRESEKAEPSNTRCWIEEDYVTKNLKVLAMVTAIKFSYPKFYRFLEKYPMALKNNDVSSSLKDGKRIYTEDLYGEDKELYTKIKPTMKFNEDEVTDIYNLLSIERSVYGYDLAPFIYFTTKPGAMELGSDKYEIIEKGSAAEDPNELISMFSKIEQVEIGKYLKWYLDVIKEDGIENIKNRRRYNLLSAVSEVAYEIPTDFARKLNAEFEELLISDYYEKKYASYPISSVEKVIRFSEVNKVGTGLVDEAVRVLIRKFAYNIDDYTALKDVLDRPGLLGDQAQNDVRDQVQNIFDKSFESGSVVFYNIKDSGHLEDWVDEKLQAVIFETAVQNYLKPNEEAAENEKGGEQ